MTRLDDFFGSASEPLHPRLRNWRTRLAEPGMSATVEVYRHETELGPTEPELNLQFRKNGSLLPLESVAWNDDLNSGLIELGVRAENRDQEAERFALGLRAAMRKAEREFGDGYFNAVLVELLRDSDLTRHREIDEVLQHAYTNRPHRDGKAHDRYTICREMIATAISGRAKELTGPLGYTQDQAKEIVVAALARYLDDRFSVSSRRRLGLL